MNWKTAISKLSESLDNLVVTDVNGTQLDNDAAFQKLKLRTEQLKNSEKTVYLIGNGASSSMASHVSADLAKNACLHTQVFTDLSLITAVANDISYDAVFSEPLKFRMKSGDILVCISSSGNSKNILNAAKMARSLGGYVITLSGMKLSNPLRSLGDLNFYVPANTYGLAETSHNTLLHYWIDLMTGDVVAPVHEESYCD